MIAVVTENVILSTREFFGKILEDLDKLLLSKLSFSQVYFPVKSVVCTLRINNYNSALIRICGYDTKAIFLVTDINKSVYFISTPVWQPPIPSCDRQELAWVKSQILRQIFKVFIACCFLCSLANFLFFFIFTDRSFYALIQICESVQNRNKQFWGFIQFRVLYNLGFYRPCKNCQFIYTLIINSEMSSPINRSLINSPQRRSHATSPTRDDFNFLTLKIARLEQQNRQVCDELQRARNRLRKAEDFQIKYDLILKQKVSLESEAHIKDSLINQYQTQIRELELYCADTKNIQFGYKIQKETMAREIQQWRLRYFQAEQIASNIRAQQEYKMNEKLMSELEVLKKYFSNQAEQYKNKIRILEINLSQKETLQSILKEKNDKNTTQKDLQIQRLQNNLSLLRDEHLKYAEEKNNELINVANKFETIFNHEIKKLRSNQHTNNEKFNLQVQGLRGLLELKNNEINELIRQSKELRQNYLSQKGQMLKEISLLRQKLYQRQRQNQLQLYNLKQRLIYLHKTDTQSMKQNFEAININLEQNNRELQNLIKKKDREIFEINARLEEKEAQLQQIIQAKNLAISQLQQSIRHSGDIKARQIDDLHSSFHKITSEKGQLSTEYETTFNFLNNQISKLSHSNQLKNQQIKDLHLEISEAKKNFSEHIKNLQRKWRQQRKQRQEERDKQRDLRQKLQDEFRQKQQRWRHRQRMLERDKQKQEREKVKQKVTIQELQKNLQRLSKHVRQNEQRLKQEMQKNQSNFVQTGSMRRQLTGELQRQKGQLQGIKKMQLDQVHRQYEIEITRLSNQNQKLMNELTQLKLSFDNLQGEYKKVKNTSKNIDRINKEKMIDYERKMTALNAQINLTQNLYNSFLSAKSRVIKKGQQS